MSGLRFSASLADRGFEASFDLAPGRTLAVLGPNGAGKSTLLGLLAGLLEPTSGRATLGERVLFDVSPGHRSITEPRRREVALLSQEALLFPHLSVLDNVAFAPRSRGDRTADARSTARRWLARAGVDELARRRPGELSGGQAQRVAIARALAAEPALLLLDEPLSALDVRVAPAIRSLLREVLADRSAVIVTHEPLDALLLADEVLILDGGKVVEAGPTRKVLSRPVTEFGARLAGLNLVQGRRSGANFQAQGGLVVPFGGGVPDGTPLSLVVRPSRLVVSGDPGAGAGSGEAGWSWVGAEIDDVEQHGESVRVSVGGLLADVPPADVIGQSMAPGVQVIVGFRHVDAEIYPTTRR